MNQLFVDSNFFNTESIKERRYPMSNRHTGSMKSMNILDSSDYIEPKDTTEFVLKIFSFDNKLISIHEKFKSELDSADNVNKKLAKNAYYNSIDYILSLDPDNISIEITESDSIYYTLLINDFSIYIEEYIDDNEVIVSSYKNGVKMKSFAGNILSVISKIRIMLLLNY